jgi:hypothetical protein
MLVRPRRPARSRHSVGVLATVLSILATSVVVPCAGATWPHERDGFILGFNLGAGSAGINLANVDSDRESGLGGNGRVGYALSPQFALGLEGNFWTREVDGEEWMFSVGAITATYYPGAQGFYVRGGIGVGTMEYSVDQGSFTLTASDDGFGLLMAAGYEWRLTRRFSLGPQLDYGYGKIDDDLSMDFLNVTAGMNWHF